MNNKQTLIAIMALSAAHGSSAFVANTPTRTISRRPLFSTIEDSTNTIADAYQQVAEVTASVERAAAEAQAAAEASESSKLIMDIPPTPVAPKTKTPAPKKKANAAHKEGVFSPIVVVAGTILGPEQLNKVRAKVITIHSDLIKSFVGTSDSAFGRAVLQQLFKYVDADNSGYIDKEELAVALSLLGFKWLKEKQVNAIFDRADVNKDGMISMEEFMDEAPRTLKTNLVKLAKNNGGDMGLLVSRKKLVAKEALTKLLDRQQHEVQQTLDLIANLDLENYEHSIFESDQDDGDNNNNSLPAEPASIAASIAAAADYGFISRSEGCRVPYNNYDTNNGVLDERFQDYGPPSNIFSLGSQQFTRNLQRSRGPLIAPFIIKAPYYVLTFLLDVIFEGRNPFQRFFLLETVARMPYFSYITMLHLYETLGFWRRSADIKRIHFAEEWNEFHHLLIQESLGGDQPFYVRFMAQHSALAYYLVLCGLWMASPSLSYKFSEMLETHAVDTYGQFVDENESKLKELPPTIRNDEGDHVNTMQSCLDPTAPTLSQGLESRVLTGVALTAATSYLFGNYPGFDSLNGIMDSLSTVTTGSGDVAVDGLTEMTSELDQILTDSSSDAPGIVNGIVGGLAGLANRLNDLNEGDWDMAGAGLEGFEVEAILQAIRNVIVAILELIPFA
ncbi:ubiquinol oxidase [Skeletonema marinoi]|uniref:Ubiquinol oxidase n=1 Tax=Skeletonema marinoi TaxID=267567 RepID=A0AAD8XUW6_9STRA|nr:ubiquinol oxidase [Skeletonema marinoi]